MNPTARTHISFFWKLQQFFLAFTLAILIFLFLGKMMSSGGHSLYDEEHWLYINRGEPVAWNGISLAGKKVELPYVILPFLSRELMNDHSEWVKVIDLRTFLPLFLCVWFAVYWMGSRLLRNWTYTRHEKLFLLFFHSVLLLICVKMYFSWFPEM